jgi:phage terminase small subunit
MYYETKQGDDELYRSIQAKIAEENEETDDDEEPKAKKQRKRRLNEASRLEQENEIDRLSNSRPKRAAGVHTSIFNFLLK